MLSRAHPLRFLVTLLLAVAFSCALNASPATDQAAHQIARQASQPPPTDQPAAPANPQSAKALPPLVLAFYYPWYGTPDGPGGASRGKKFVHWEAPDVQNGRIGASTNQPVGGAYDSHDPALLDRHCRLAKASGIDGLIISWWGKDTFEDQAVAPLLSACAKAGLSACIYYEQVATPGTPESVAAEIKDLIARYSAAPAYLKVKQDGKDHPVVFIYGRAIQQLGIGKWHSVQEILARADEPRPLLIGDDFSAAAVKVFDGAHSYGPAGDVAAAIKKGESAEAWARRTMPWWADCGQGGAAARKAGKVSCATVFPGYDDTKVRNPGLVVDRAGGSLYEALWREAVSAKPDWILVTSFNEWHEGSEIEPSKEHGDKYGKMTAEWADRFKRSRP